MTPYAACVWPRFKSRERPISFIFSPLPKTGSIFIRLGSSRAELNWLKKKVQLGTVIRLWDLRAYESIALALYCDRCSRRPHGNHPTKTKLIALSYHDKICWNLPCQNNEPQLQRAEVDTKSTAWISLIGDGMLANDRNNKITGYAV